MSCYSNLLTHQRTHAAATMSCYSNLLTHPRTRAAAALGTSKSRPDNRGAVQACLVCSAQPFPRSQERAATPSLGFVFAQTRFRATPLEPVKAKIVYIYMCARVPKGLEGQSSERHTHSSVCVCVCNHAQARVRWSTWTGGCSGRKCPWLTLECTQARVVSC